MSPRGPRRPPERGRARPVVEYTPDPHGGALFSALTAAAGRSLNGARAVVPHNPQWFGWTRPPQKFQGDNGAIAASLGGVAPIAPRNSELSREKTAEGVNARSIFADRMTRRTQ
jgi:hypothetical protein